MGILVLWLRIKSGPVTLKVHVLNHWTTREFLRSLCSAASFSPVTSHIPDSLCQGILGCGVKTTWSSMAAKHNGPVAWLRFNFVIISHWDLVIYSHCTPLGADQWWAESSHHFFFPFLPLKEIQGHNLLKYQGSVALKPYHSWTRQPKIGPGKESTLSWCSSPLFQRETHFSLSEWWGNNFCHIILLV